MDRQLSLRESALLTDLAMCVNYYRLFSPGLFCCVHAPVRLDETQSERPGLCAFVNYGIHKQADPDDLYSVVHGPPNFVLDVFLPDFSDEYERRRAAYEQAGVEEYVAVWDTDPLTWNWNRQEDGRFSDVPPGEPAISSSALPGLWIPERSFQQRDWWAIMAAIARGVTRRGHHDLMDSIWNAESQD